MYRGVWRCMEVGGGQWDSRRWMEVGGGGNMSVGDKPVNFTWFWSVQQKSFQFATVASPDSLQCSGKFATL